MHFSTGDGGRETAILSGHRPHFDAGATWQDEPLYSTATVRLTAGALEPGSEAEAVLEPMSPEYWDHLRPGMSMRMLEGSRAVGEAYVLGRDWPTELPSGVTAFVRAAREMCAFVEDQPQPTLVARLHGARNKLLALYTAALSLPDREPSMEASSAPPAFRTDDWKNFEQDEFYWEVFDPYDDSPSVTGSLSDDVLDVYLDVRRGLWHWDRHEHDNAVWDWRFSFESHWGDHAIDALRALHRACGKDRT